MCKGIDEVLRYMRTSRKEPDEQTLQLAREAIDEIASLAVPRYVVEIFSKEKLSCIENSDSGASDNCSETGNDLVVLKTPYGAEEFRSKRLCEFLDGYDRVGVFCATLGLEVDRAIEFASHVSAAKSMALQAAAAARIESLCDEICERRFSPGYYDLDVSNQQKIFRMLDVEHRIGVKLTSAFEMVPLKSVSALFGV